MSKVVWNPNGMSFAALDKANLVFVFPQEQFFDSISFQENPEMGSARESGSLGSRMDQ